LQWSDEVAMLSPEVATLSPYEGPTTEDGFSVAELLPEPIFRGLLAREVSRALRYREFFSVWVIGLTSARGVRPIPEADSLAWLTQALRAKLRKSDAIGLLPDGLGVILAQVAEEPAVRVWSRVLQHVRRIAINRASEAPGGPVLVSVGGACFPRDGQTDVALLAHAVVCLHLAREAGGGRIVCDPAPG
jgi:hypothetical protein